MKFIVSSSTLLSHLQAISRVISSKNTLAILDDFLFTLSGTELKITASDLDTTMITSIQVESAEGEGSFASTARTLLDYLKEFSEQPLNFNIDESTLTITSDNDKFQIAAIDGDEYPSLPALDSNLTEFMISADALVSGINKSIFATADDELRPVMNGIYFDINESGLTFAASDAHKLVRITDSSVKDAPVSSFILPKKPAALLKNVLPKEDGNVHVEFDTKNASFTLPNYKLVCRLVEGRYPNYNSVIPKDNPNKMIVDRSALLTTLKRVAVCSNQASNLIKIELEANKATISAQDIDFSISASAVLACQYSGDELTIGFKSSFLIEILSNIESDEVVLEFADSTRAGVILPFEKDETQDLLMLLMPMMLND
ncbi:DNA polymerase III subunit beta [Saccharicrinis sp. FJH54]|uniref:DNA polymerase III subunit beta n=1 Tax=Saccharicrinis sp. FJH54 TaxID=3344665 RepID=UPI0035D443F5